MTLSQSTAIASAFLIDGLALERYFKVCRPTTTDLSKDGSRNVCISVSVTTFVLSAPCIVFYDDTRGTCYAVRDDTIILIISVYYMVFKIVFIIIIVMLLFCYINIALTVLRSKEKLAKYAISNVHKTSERRYIPCYHISFFINRSHSPDDRQEPNTTEIHVLQESSTDTDKDHKQKRSVKTAENAANNGEVINLRSNQSKSKRTMRATRITFIVFLIFLISWFPVWISFAIQAFATPAFRRSTNVAVFMLFGNMSFLINTFSNPIVYVLMDLTFRTKMRKAFACKRYM